MNIALLTCERLPNLTEYDQLLIPELAKHNIQSKAVIWNDKSVNWNDYDCLIFRNTWDYYEKETEFNHWLNQIEQLKIKTLNALEIIQQNKHKFYLQTLEKQGFKILPTVFIEKTTKLNLPEIMPNHWKKAVIKPAFSAGSYLTEVFDVSDIEKINQQYQSIAVQKELLLQEFMAEIQTEGETSFLFFNKKFSHAVNKKPKKGDFRIQVQFGGQYTAFKPNDALIYQAQQIVNTFPEPILYARVDGIITNNQLQLMEVECIEPDLYFQYGEDALQKFVDSILKLIK
jgi:glutathione synthase/RimK-type ligase-like ATP-grasp enzyme